MSDAPWSCPSCRESLEDEREALACRSCGSRWPLRDGIPHFAAGRRPEHFAAARRDHLRRLRDEGHFWFPPRRRLLSALLDRFAASCESIVEIGCADGDFLDSVAGRFERTLGFDIWASERWPRRLERLELAQADLGQIPLASGSQDGTLALDVLEHCEPAELLGEMRRIVRAGGLALVTVPASRCLWSELDEQAGHRCRYDRRQLERELRTHGWTPIFITHYQMLLFPLIYWTRRFRGGRRLERSPRPWMHHLLLAINSFEVCFSHRISLPYGSSLVAVARKR